MKLKYKIVKTLFSVLLVLVLSCTFALNIFALDFPALYSSGGSFNGNDIYTGNVDYLISFYSGTVDATYSYALNPCFSVDNNLGSVSSSTYDLVYYSTESIAESAWFNCYYSSFEFSDNFFTSYIPPDNSYFSCGFTLEAGYDSSDFSPDSMTIEARDFYFYLDPDSDLSYDPYYDAPYCESFLYLECNSVYSGAEATICYVEAGVDDSPSNYKYYDYSLSSSVTNGSPGTSFSVLPSDESFGGAYSEPTLIYIKYLTFSVPVNYSAEPIVSGTYASYNMDYRNIDVSSYVEPFGPMNPAIFRDYTGWLGTAVGGFLDLQIVDGFTLGGILMVIIAFMITLWFLKVFAGG